MATLNYQRVNGDIDVPNSHWLVEKNRGVSSEPPEKQQVCLMVGILVGALEHDFLFSHIFRIITTTKKTN